MEAGAMQWKAEPTKCGGEEVYKSHGGSRQMNIYRRNPGKRWRRVASYVDEDDAEFIVDVLNKEQS
jgi:hypothetical protein